MMLQYTGERAIPWNPTVGCHILHHHTMRYAWASQFAWQKDVIDLGCGSGYGTFLLSQFAKSAQGVDVDKTAVMYARMHFQATNLRYNVVDITGAIPDADVYFCFEVLEHLDDPAALLEKIGNRRLVWSMPVDDGSQFHKRPYSADEIHNMMGGTIYYQSDDGLIYPSMLTMPGGLAYLLGVRN